MTIPQDPLARLRERFLARCRDHLAVLKAAASSGRAVCGADDDLLKVVHSLAGAGGTFGFPEISARAFAVESLLIAQEIDNYAAKSSLQALILEIEVQLS